jgi:hypothetical protein
MAFHVPEIIKRHPVISIGSAVAIVIVGVLIASSGGGSAASSTDTTSGSASDGDALSQINASLSAQMATVSAQKEVALNNNATQITLAGIGADSANYQTAKQAEVAEATLASQERTTIQTSTLAANVAQSQIQANENVSTAQIASQTAQTQAILQNNTQLAEIASKPKGLFSFLFG